VSVGLSIRVSGEGAQIPARVLGVLAPARLNPVIGRAAANVVVAHLRAKNTSSPNQLGGKRTNYYAAAARATSFAVVSDSEVVVSIAQRGIRQRFFGGTIKPRTAKFLTVPVHPSAHGKRAREFSDLEIVFGSGGRPVALARRATGARRFGEILYRLVRSVTQRPDPSVLPESSAVRAEIVRAVDATLARVTRRAS
jgi:hypothetical protein